jgi:hypothetical protein
MTRTTFQRFVLYGVPAAYIPLGILHPMENPEVGDATSLFLALHVAQLALIAGLGYLIWLAVEGLQNRGARTARALILPFVVAYTAMDALLGLAWGYLARQASMLPAADQGPAQRLLEAVLEPSGPGYLLYFGGGLLWAAAIMAVVRAHVGTAPTRPLFLMGTGALIFASGHAAPSGPLGMGLFLFGIVLLERHGQQTATRPSSGRPRQARKLGELSGNGTLRSSV